MSDIQHDDPTTGVAAGNSFHVANRPVTVSLVGASLGDVVAALQRKDSAGNWQDVYDGGTLVTLTATATAEIVWSGGEFRLNYTTRGNSVGACHGVGPGGR